MQAWLFVSAFVLLSCSGAMSSDNKQKDNEGDTSKAIPKGSLVLDSAALGISAIQNRSYSDILKAVERKRIRLKQRYLNAGEADQQKVIAQAARELEQALVNGVFPFWYGTPWDFNGTSNSPGSGQIACGYFVSTTLKHCGLNVNRYRLAQQASAKSCRILARGDEVNRYCPASQKVMSDSLASRKPGLYAVGLDYHVGFVLVRQKQVFFIHSTFIGPDGVVIEKAEDSPAFNSRCYVVAALTPNPRFIRTWLLEENVKVN